MIGTDLTKEHASQLYRYFSVTEARFGVLTNGIAYRFYTDLERPNKMDFKPFLEFSLLNLDETIVAELKKFTSATFDLDHILATASELKYTKEIKRILAEQMNTPTDDFVRLLVADIYPGRMTKAALERFSQITKHAFHQFINDRISDRLKTTFVKDIKQDSANDARAIDQESELGKTEGESKINAMRSSWRRTMSSNRFSERS